jgi:hypothetical protein
MAQTPAQKLRTRNLATAKRSLKLIAEQAAADLATFENKGVPDLGTFRASTANYEKALLAVSLLDSLDASLAIEAHGADGSGPPEVEVRREALAALIDLLRASDVGYAIQDAEEGSLLGDIVAVAGTGEPAAAGAE